MTSKMSWRLTQNEYCVHCTRNKLTHVHDQTTMNSPLISFYGMLYSFNLVFAFSKLRHILNEEIRVSLIVLIQINFPVIGQSIKRSIQF